MLQNKISAKVTFEAFTTEKIPFLSIKILGWNLSRHKRAVICKLIDIVCLSELNVVYCSSVRRTSHSIVVLIWRCLGKWYLFWCCGLSSGTLLIFLIFRINKNASLKTMSSNRTCLEVKLCKQELTKEKWKSEFLEKKVNFVQYF